MLILQNVHKNRELETQPVTAEENVRHGYKTDTRGATFWWLGDSSRWCFIFSSFAAISLILMLTCSNQTLQISSTNDTETTSSTLIFFCLLLCWSKRPWHLPGQKAAPWRHWSWRNAWRWTPPFLCWSSPLCRPSSGHRWGGCESSAGTRGFCVRKTWKIKNGMSSFSSTDKSQSARQKHWFSLCIPTSVHICQVNILFYHFITCLYKIYIYTRMSPKPCSRWIC